MVPVRKQLTIKEGVAVDLLVTPHLAVYEEAAGIPPLPDDATNAQVWERYADLMYLAAINAWELDGHGTAEDFPHTRGDFHEYAAADVKRFAKDIDFAISALTGKSAKELVEKDTKDGNSPDSEAPDGKKKASGWIGRRLKRSS